MQLHYIQSYNHYHNQGITELLHATSSEPCPSTILLTPEISSLFTHIYHLVISRILYKWYCIVHNFFFNKVSYILGWLGIHSVAQDNFDLLELRGVHLCLVYILGIRRG